MIPCISLSRQALEFFFCRQIQIRRENILLGTSENLHALESYSSLCYMLSYKSAFVALIKKNSEVPSNALIFVAELINSTLLEVHEKTSSICKIAFFLHMMAPTFAIYSLVILSLIMKWSKNGPFFMVLYELFHSKQLLRITLHTDIHLRSLLRKIKM